MVGISVSRGHKRKRLQKSAITYLTPSGHKKVESNASQKQKKKSRSVQTLPVEHAGPAPGPPWVAGSVPSRHCEHLPVRVVILSGKLCFQPSETCKKKKEARSRIAEQGFRHSASCHSGSCERFPALANRARGNVQKKKGLSTHVWFWFRLHEEKRRAHKVVGIWSRC